ncbi:MAG: N-acyl homoserine lactonase family protein [Planctomycetota bacterium]|nr:MAG: N-acyl homoserine lactonase family protein [Planctomycetota bacterium]
MGVGAVYALQLGSNRLPRGLLERAGLLGSLEPVALSYLAFLLEHPQGWVLVDTGPGAGWRRSPLGRLAPPERAPAGSLRERLAVLGLAPEQLRAVVMTHLDADHTGGLPELEQVPVHVCAEQLRYARRPAWRDAALGRFAPEEFEAPRRLCAFVPDCRERPAGLELGPFRRVHDLFGDGLVWAVELPGHTPGHCGVLVRLASGGQLLLCGDAAESRGQLEGLEPGPLTSWAAHDPARMHRTLRGLQALVARGLAVLPSHEPELGARAAAAPLRCDRG